jgi:hypothetical protein
LRNMTPVSILQKVRLRRYGRGITTPEGQLNRLYLGKATGTIIRPTVNDWAAGDLESGVLEFCHDKGAVWIVVGYITMFTFQDGPHGSSTGL